MTTIFAKDHVLNVLGFVVHIWSLALQTFKSMKIMLNLQVYNQGHRVWVLFRHILSHYILGLFVMVQDVTKIIYAAAKLLQ